MKGWKSSWSGRGKQSDSKSTSKNASPRKGQQKGRGSVTDTLTAAGISRGGRSSTGTSGQPTMRRVSKSSQDLQLNPARLQSLEARRRSAATLQLEAMDNHITSYKVLLDYGIKETDQSHRLVMGLIKAAEHQEQLLDQQQMMITDNAGFGIGGSNSGASVWLGPAIQNEKRCWNTQIEQLAMADTKLTRSRKDLEKHRRELENQSKVLKAMETAEENVLGAWDSYLKEINRKEEVLGLGRRGTNLNNALSADGGGGGASTDSWLLELKYRKALTVQSEAKWDTKMNAMRQALTACLTAEVRRRMHLHDIILITTIATKQLFVDLETSCANNQQALEDKPEVTIQEIEKDVEEAILNKIEELENKKKQDSTANNSNEQEGQDDASLDHENDASLDFMGTATSNDNDNKDSNSGVVASFYQDMFQEIDKDDGRKKKIKNIITSTAERQRIACEYRDKVLDSSPLQSSFLVHATLVEVIDTADLGLAVITTNGIVHIFIISSLTSLQDPVESAIKQLLVASTPVGTNTTTSTNLHEQEEREKQQKSSTLKEPFKSLSLKKMQVSGKNSHQVLEITEPNCTTKLCLRTVSDEEREALIQSIEQQQKKH